MESPENKIKSMVRQRYAEIARSVDNGLSDGCCGGSSCLVDIMDLGGKLDYTGDQLGIGLGEANLGLGCGNPLAESDLRPGENVLDLGSGAGFDTFLAAEIAGGHRSRYDP